MDRLILKQEVVDEINKDAELYGKVAKAMGIGAPSLRPVLKSNHVNLTRASVLQVLRNHLGVAQDSDLLEPVQESKKPVAA